MPATTMTGLTKKNLVNIQEREREQKQDEPVKIAHYFNKNLLQNCLDCFILSSRVGVTDLLIKHILSLLTAADKKFTADNKKNSLQRRKFNVFMLLQRVVILPFFSLVIRCTSSLAIKTKLIWFLTSGKSSQKITCQSDSELYKDLLYFRS